MKNSRRIRISGEDISLEASLNPFRFSSEIHDSELDLVYYNYRHYSPSLGRFLSRDPIAEQGGLNLYAFVCNNSIAQTDMLGREEKKPCCNGVLYNPQIKCCVDNKLIPKTESATILMKLGHNYSARDDFPKRKSMPKKLHWVYICCTGKEVNDEFLALGAPGVQDHNKNRLNDYIYPRGDDQNFISVERAYQIE